MRSSRSAWEIAGGLALKGVTLVVAVVLFSLVRPGEVGEEDGEPAGGAPWTVDSAGRCDTTRVEMTVREGKPYANYALVDEGGKEVVQLMYVRSGDVVVRLGEGFPVRSSLSSKVDGACEATINDGSVVYRLKIRPRGVSGFSVVDIPHGVREGLGIDREGELVHDPAITERP